MSNEVYETVAKTFFKLAKTAINVQRNKLRKIFSYEKTYCFLKILSELFLTFSGKVCQSCQNCILRSFEKFWRKTLFKALDKVPKLFLLWAKSIRALFGKFLPGLSQLPSARPEQCFAENHFFVRRNFASCVNFVAAATFFFSAKTI